MITNSKLLIDRDCPMCSIYGKLFKQLGLIDYDVLSTYQEIDSKYTKGVDMNRAKSEIALVDLKSKHIDYGVDSFARILFHKYPFFLRVLRLKPFRFLSNLIYLFISLNRHVIIRPSRSCASPICAPSLHRGFRLAYSIITALLTGWVLSNFFGEMMKVFSVDYPPYVEYLICFGQIVWQGLFVLVNYKNSFWDYLGHMSTVSLIGALLLLPPLIIAKLLPLSPLYLIGSFGIVLGIMIQEHLTRCKRSGMGINTTLSWIVYRLFILLFLFIQFFMR